LRASSIAGVVVPGIGERHWRTDAAVHRQRHLEMLLRLRPLVPYLGEQAEIAVGRPAAGNAGAQHDIAPGVRRQQPVQCGRPRGITERGADLAQIDDAKKPATVARYRGEVLGCKFLKFRACLVVLPELKVNERQSRPPDAGSGLPLQKHGHRRPQRRQPALIAAQREDLHAQQVAMGARGQQRL
jgi:hypothetical protein